MLFIWETEKYITPFYWFIPKISATPSGQWPETRRQELNLGLSSGWWRPKYLNHHLLTLGLCMNRKLESGVKLELHPDSDVALLLSQTFTPWREALVYFHCKEMTNILGNQCVNYMICSIHNLYIYKIITPSLEICIIIMAIKQFL